MAKRPGQPARGSTSGRPIMVLLDVLGQRWTLRVLWELAQGRANFRDLRARCSDLSPTVLNSRLKELRELAIVDLDESGYGLTHLGTALTDRLANLDGWATQWAKEIEKKSSTQV